MRGSLAAAAGPTPTGASSSSRSRRSGSACVTGTALGTDHAWVAAVAWLAIVLVNGLYLRRPQ
jgi:hypothetical protein